MIDHLSQLIEEERGNVQYGGSRDRLEDLLNSRKEHKQEIDILDANLKLNSETVSPALSQEAVTQLITELYGLKHYGKDLQRSLQVVGRSQEVGYREQPRIIRARQHWGKHAETPLYGDYVRNTVPSSSFGGIRQVAGSVAWVGGRLADFVIGRRQ